MQPEDQQLTVGAALSTARILWPEFVRKHGCVFLGWHANSASAPLNDTATGWEAFINHTHILDEFEHDHDVVNSDGEGVVYNEQHPDFISACELGKRIAELWALKLKVDFPSERFRVYYTQYDNPIVRFHKVRDGEEYWLPDDVLRSSVNPEMRSALVLDTAKIHLPIRDFSISVQ